MRFNKQKSFATRLEFSRSDQSICFVVISQLYSVRLCKARVFLGMELLL